MSANLVVRDLTVEYSSGGYVVRPIEGFSLTARPGSLVLLLGPSGCGKTTLLSCMGGILRPAAGSIRVGDIEVTKLRGDALSAYRRESVGFVFQAINLVQGLTARENVMVPMGGANIKRGEARRRAEGLLEAFGLSDRSKHHPSELSSGQQQRVAIARALALDPQLVLADEPTAHLDYVQVESVLRVLKELVADDRVVVVATHDQRLVPLADTVVELAPVSAEASGEPRKLTLKSGDVVFSQGSFGDLIYTVESGEIEIVGEKEDGSDEQLTVVGPGTYFGEIGPLYGMPRAATARALGPAVVVGHTVRDFRERMARSKAGSQRKSKSKAKRKSTLRTRKPPARSRTRKR